MESDSSRRESLALAFAAVVALATIVWLMSAVGVGILLGVLMAFTFQPTYERLARRSSAPFAALAIVLGSTLAMALTFGTLVWILVNGLTVLGPEVVASFGADGGAGKRSVVAVEGMTSRLGIPTEELHAKVLAALEGAVGRAESVAVMVTSTIGSSVLGLFFVMLTMYFVLRRRQGIVRSMLNALPLRPEYTLKLLDAFHIVGRATLLSTVVVGLLEGAIATVGYTIVGLPQPLFFGALTAFASLVPGLGTMLVWMPASLVLVLSGHVGSGVVLAVWGVVAVSGIPTYVIRPRVVGRGSDVPALFTFIALLGGTAVLGLKGLIVGPVLMTMAIAILRLYADEERARKHAAPA